MMVTALVRWCADVKTAPPLPCYSDSPCEINWSADGTISILCLRVWDYTINHNNNNAQQAGHKLGGGSNKHPIYLADYPGEALLFATREEFWGGDVAATIILQQRKKKVERLNQRISVNSVIKTCCQVPTRSTLPKLHVSLLYSLI